MNEALEKSMTEAERVAASVGEGAAGSLAVEYPPIMRAAELVAKLKEVPPLPEIVQGVFRVGKLGLLSGASKCGKTWTLLELAYCVALGRAWLGFPTMDGGGRVLYCDAELGEDELEKRLEFFNEAFGCGDGPSKLNVWSLRAVEKQIVGLMAYLQAQFEKGEKWDLIVLDPISCFLGARDENANADIMDLLDVFIRFSEANKCGVMLAHHHAKGDSRLKAMIDRMSGAGAWARRPDTILDLVETSAGAGTFAVEMVLRGFPRQEPIVVRRDSFPCWALVEGDEARGALEDLYGANPQKTKKNEDYFWAVEAVAKDAGCVVSTSVFLDRVCAKVRDGGGQLGKNRARAVVRAAVKDEGVDVDMDGDQGGVIVYGTRAAIAANRRANAGVVS